MPMTTAEHELDLAALMREHQAGVWRFVRALGADTSTADDVTQDVFLAVYRKPFEQRGRAQTAGYLRTVARNLFLKSRRKSARLVNMAELNHLEARWSELAGEDDGAELMRALKQCLHELDDKPRSALDLQYKEGRQRVEIAESLGMTDDGIKTLLRRTKARLKQCMEHRLQSDGTDR